MRSSFLSMETQSSQRGLMLVIGSVVIYTLAFFPLYQASGAGIAALALVPSIAAGWFLGLRRGIVCTVLIIVLNTVLIFAVGAGASVVVRGISGNLMLILVAAIVGWLRGLLLTVQRQSQQLTSEREALQQEITERNRVEDALRQEMAERKLTDEALRKAQLYVEQKSQQIQRMNELFRSATQQTIKSMEQGASKGEVTRHLYEVEREFSHLE